MLHKYINKGLVHGLHHCQPLLPTHICRRMDECMWFIIYETTEDWHLQHVCERLNKHLPWAINLRAKWLAICLQVGQLKSAADRPLGRSLRSEEKGVVLWHISLQKIYCQSAVWCILLRTDNALYCFIKGDYCRRRVGVNSRYYFWKIIPEVEEVVQWLLYAGFPNLH